MEVALMAWDDNQEPIEDGTVEVSTALSTVDRGEINQQIETAKHYPRHIAEFRKEAYQLVTLDEETAASCIYALPRGKEKDPETGKWVEKIIKGPSARFAEILGYSWGNCRIGARVVGEDDQFVTAQGMFFDLEKNVAISYEVKRRITNSKGERFNADMIGVTSNAACSIGLRNAVLKGIPKALWKGIYNAAEKTIMGTIETLNDRRTKLIDKFKPFAVTPPMICEALGLQGTSEIGLDHLVTLQGMLTALQDGDSSVETMFGKKSTAGPKTDKATMTVPVTDSTGKQTGEVKVDPESVISIEQATKFYQTWKASGWKIAQAKAAMHQIAGVEESKLVKQANYGKLMEWAATKPVAVEENLDAEPAQ
jgi:hypothetical protein